MEMRFFISSNFMVFCQDLVPKPHIFFNFLKNVLLMVKKYFAYLFILTLSLPVYGQTAFADNSVLLGIDAATGNSPYGNGVAFFDYNDDGWDDVTITTETGAPLRFFRNNGGTFTEEALLAPAITYRTKQVNWVDFDNDGDKDLFVTSDTDGNRLLENTGSMTFVDITVAAGLPTTNMYTYGASWGDIDNDGDLDLHVNNRDEVLFVIPNKLYRNNGDSTFTDISVSAGLNTTAHSSFCSAFFDFNNDGFLDLFVANDRYFFENFMYKNNGDGTFTDVGASSGAGIFMNAMSATVDDFNHDGWFDIYITNTAEGNVFLMNNGDETFTDVGLSTGTTFNSFGWGAVFLDAENDEDLDLYVSGRMDPSNLDLIPYAFYENQNNGVFSEPAGVGFEDDDRSSYSNAIGDLNNDGLSDILVSNEYGDNLYLFRNKTITTNNYLKIALEGTASNRDGIGSIIEIGIGSDKQYRLVICGEGYLSQNSGVESFGLGANLVVDYVKITWLSGIVDYFYNVGANQVLEVEEGSGTLSLNGNEENEVIMFPNPANDILNLRSNSSILKIDVLNELGQVIHELNPDQHEWEMDISNLATGLYFLRITNHSGISKMKFIKN